MVYEVNEVRVDSAAVPYIREALADGRALSQYLLHLPLDSGRIVTYLPPSTPPEAIGHFGLGGVLPTFPELDIRFVDANGRGVRAVPLGDNPVRRQIEDIMAGFIAGYLQRPGRHYAVFEDVLRSPTDGVVATWTVKYFSCQAEVCLFLTAADTEPATIIQTKRTAASWLGTGILVAGDDLPELTSGQVVATEVLQQLAARTEHIILRAYDAESELSWSRL